MAGGECVQAPPQRLILNTPPPQVGQAVLFVQHPDEVLLQVLRPGPNRFLLRVLWPIEPAAAADKNQPVLHVPRQVVHKTIVTRFLQRLIGVEKEHHLVRPEFAPDAWASYVLFQVGRKSFGHHRQQPLGMGAGARMPPEPSVPGLCLEPAPYLPRFTLHQPEQPDDIYRQVL